MVLATIAIDRVRAAWGATAAAGALGAAVLASLALESALGWTAALTPLLGGSELDGGRFYGLPNVDIGLLVGASLFVAAWIGRPLQGAILVAAVGMFAGFPWTGSNLGGPSRCSPPPGSGTGSAGEEDSDSTRSRTAS